MTEFTVNQPLDPEIEAALITGAAIWWLSFVLPPTDRTSPLGQRVGNAVITDTPIFSDAVRKAVALRALTGHEPDGSMLGGFPVDRRAIPERYFNVFIPPDEHAQFLAAVRERIIEHGLEQA